MSTVDEARRLVRSEFERFAETVSEVQSLWYFDMRNRDMWMDDFIARLKARFQQPDRIASND